MTVLAISGFSLSLIGLFIVGGVIGFNTMGLWRRKQSAKNFKTHLWSDKFFSRCLQCGAQYHGEPEETCYAYSKCDSGKLGINDEETL